MTDPQNQPGLIKHLNPAQEALHNFAENVSIAGLKEAFVEHVIWIRHLFKIALIISCGFIMYFVYRDVIKVALKRGMTTNVEEVSRENLPSPNVTICVEFCGNETFIRENVTVPEDTEKLIQQRIGLSKNQFLDEFARYLAYACRSREKKASLIKLFRKIYESNQQIFDFGRFRRLNLPSCEKMFKSCKFNGKTFDCCERAQKIVTDDGICYQLGIGHDPNSKVRYKSTLEQTEQGPKGGLSIEAALETKDNIWMLENEYDTFRDNGFKVFVSPSAMVPLLSPVTAPDKSKTFIRVNANERALQKKCIATQKDAPKLMEDGYYDPYGHTCIVDNIVEYIHENTHCYGSVGHYIFNSTTVCSPELNYMINTGIRGANIELGGIGGKGKDQAIVKKVQARMTEMAGLQKTKCRPLCRFWEYTSSASYIDLEPTVKNNLSQNVMYSNIHVYYADFLYRKTEEVEAVPPYLAFYNFGNIVMLYFGMSIIAFFEFFYYLSAYLLAVWSYRKRGCTVAPAATSGATSVNDVENAKKEKLADMPCNQIKSSVTPQVPKAMKTTNARKSLTNVKAPNTHSRQIKKVIAPSAIIEVKPKDGTNVS